MNGLYPAVAALIACAATMLLGYPVIPFLKKLKFGQTILDIGPKWHKSKEGTPTMGGVMIIIGFFISLVVTFGLLLINKTGAQSLAWNGMRTATVFAGAGLALGMGLIGFIDDYIKVAKKRNLGLTANQKTFLQLAVAAAYLLSLRLSGIETTWLPFAGEINISSGIGLIAWPVMLLFTYGFVNAVNLTDGIDGLASSVTMVVCSFFMIIAGLLNMAGANIAAAAGAGACLGFLIWNAHPAKVFMGDTGSMFLGGLAVGLSFMIGKPVLLILAGITYLLEALSVMLQVAHFKRTGKRLFKMSPIHHHFEMSGWSEERIVLVFSGATAVGCLIAALPVIFNL